MVVKAAYPKRVFAQDDPLPSPPPPTKLQLIVTGPHAHARHGACWDVRCHEDMTMHMLIPLSCPDTTRLVVSADTTPNYAVEQPLPLVS